MSSEEEFAARARIDIATLRVWLDEGWIVPGRFGGRAVFRDVDMARAALINDLDELMGVNGEGISVVLDLTFLARVSTPRPLLSTSSEFSSVR